MNRHRYTQLILPAERYLRSLKPSARRLVSWAEGSLVAVLVVAVLLV